MLLYQLMQELDSLDVDLGEHSEVVVSSLAQSAVAPVCGPVLTDCLCRGLSQCACSRGARMACAATAAGRRGTSGTGPCRATAGRKSEICIVLQIRRFGSVWTIDPPGACD